MAYAELKHYRSYILEIREYGDTGWAVHAYAPMVKRSARKVVVTSSREPRDLPRLIQQAKSAVDHDLADADGHLISSQFRI